jgi:hypothetical protein
MIIKGTQRDLKRKQTKNFYITACEMDPSLSEILTGKWPVEIKSKLKISIHKSCVLYII